MSAVVEFDHKDAEKYDRRESVRIFSEAILKLLNSMPWFSSAKGTILDFGCGTGVNAIRLAQQGHTVTGVDVSQHMLNVFQQKLETETPQVKSRITLIHQHHDNDSPPETIKRNSFNVALCLLVLHHVESKKQQEVLQTVVSSLMEGGRLVVVEFEETPRSIAIREAFRQDNHQQEEDKTTDASTVEHNSHHHHDHSIEWMSRQALITWLEAAGMTVSESKLFVVPMQEQGTMDCYYVIATK